MPSGIYVDDQQKALDLYTKALWFEKNQDITVREFRRVSVKSSESGDVQDLVVFEVESAAGCPSGRSSGDTDRSYRCSAL